MSPKFTWQDIVLAKPKDHQHLAELFARGFEGIPVVTQILPSVSQRRTILPYVFLSDVEWTAENGLAFTLPDLSAAALVLVHNGHDPDPAPDPDIRLAEIAGDEVADRFHAFFTHLHKQRLELLGDRPHYHLLALVRARGAEHVGKGALMLEHVHRTFGVPEKEITGYLEAASHLLVPYYARHGWVPVGDHVQSMQPMTRTS